MGKEEDLDTKTQLQALYQVQQLDSALAALQKQYGAMDQGRAEKAALDAAKAANQEADARVHASSATQTDTELELKAIEAKTAEYETKLYGGTIHVPKELQAIQDEVEMLKRQRIRLDEKILTTMDELEANRKLKAETQARMTEANRAYKLKAAAAKLEAATLVDQARTLTAQRAEAVKTVPPSLLKKYDVLRNVKNGLAIVMLEDGNACGGCKMGLASALVVRIQDGLSMEVCDNCGRLICPPEGKKA